MSGIAKDTADGSVAERTETRASLIWPDPAHDRPKIEQVSSAGATGSKPVRNIPTTQGASRIVHRVGGGSSENGVMA